MSTLLIVTALAVIIGFIALAKRGRGRRMGRYIRGNIDEKLSLTTLGAATAVGEDFDQVVNERTLVSSIVASYSMLNMTAAAADGPIVVGVAHSDYTDTEIQEFITASTGWDEGNKVAQEQMSRKIRRIGTFQNPPELTVPAVLNDGKPIKTKLNWILLQGQTLQLWCFNQGSSALDTTVPVVHASGHANLWPR